MLVERALGQSASVASKSVILVNRGTVDPGRVFDAALLATAARTRTLRDFRVGQNTDVAAILCDFAFRLALKS
jgi:hypothetical protein